MKWFFTPFDIHVIQYNEYITKEISDRKSKMCSLYLANVNLMC